MDSLNLAIDLIKKPSISPDDKGCQDIIARQLEDSGFIIENLRFGSVDNLWCHHGNKNKPTLCFLGHTDVVPAGSLSEWDVDPFKAEIKNNKLIARGAADMKASLAAMIIAAKKFVKDFPNHNGSIAFLITSDEEGEAENGTKKVMETLSKRNEQITWCVVGEPSSNNVLGDTIRIGRRGSLSGLLTLFGTLGHVAYPLESENVMHSLSKFIENINKEPLDNGNKYFPPTTFQMVNIHSDSKAPNVVPDKLTCRFNFRYSTEWTLASLSKHVEDILESLKINYDITWKSAGEPFITKEGILSKAVIDSIKEETSIIAKPSTSGGTSDGRFVAPYGVDVVEFGPINETIHKVNECIEITDISKLENIYYNISKKILAD